MQVNGAIIGVMQHLPTSQMRDKEQASERTRILFTATPLVIRQLAIMD